MKKIVSFIPNLLTLCNIVCGVVAIFFAFSGEVIYGFWAIVAAGVFDFFDGFVARLLRAQSEVGLQLDSLCDVVSFGVAPAVILTLGLQPIAGVWAYGALILAPFAAYRLAMFNVDTQQSYGFRGLPTPAMALLVVSLTAVVVPKLPHSTMSIVGALCVVSALAVIMVSKVPMFALKFKNFSIKDNYIRYVFLILSVIILLLFGVYLGVGLIIALYVVLSLMSAIVGKK